MESLFLGMDLSTSQLSFESIIFPILGHQEVPLQGPKDHPSELPSLLHQSGPVLLPELLCLSACDPRDREPVLFIHESTAGGGGSVPGSAAGLHAGIGGWTNVRCMSHQYMSVWWGSTILNASLLMSHTFIRLLPRHSHMQGAMCLMNSCFFPNYSEN
jgi:hypothetical protein